MRVKAGLIGGAMALGAIGFLLAVVLVSGASAHSNPCHTQHTCPSDHHTYVWIDPSTGLGWDCTEPEAPEYDPTRDTTTIVWDGLTYYCRAGASTTTTTLPTTATEPTVTLTTSTTTSTTTTTVPTLVLPIKSITPGVDNPTVRQGTIKKTICVKGWTKTIRPPVSYTNALKLMQMQQYGETGSPSDYEEDHFIPLELGGAPKNPMNLWPEPHAQSKINDPLETKLKREVCKGLIKLAKARAEIRAFKDANG
jgi:hypothetical protein